MKIPSSGGKISQLKQRSKNIMVSKAEYMYSLYISSNLKEKLKSVMHTSIENREQVKHSPRRLRTDLFHSPVNSSSLEMVALVISVLERHFAYIIECKTWLPFKRSISILRKPF